MYGHIQRQTPAKLREYARVFVLWCRKYNIDANEREFEKWMKTSVKDEGFKVSMKYLRTILYVNIFFFFSLMWKVIEVSPTKLRLILCQVVYSQVVYS